MGNLLTGDMAEIILLFCIESNLLLSYIWEKSSLLNGKKYLEIIFEES